ncbi:ATP-dependent Clp protease ATP-binding subunit ClpX [Nonomuraea coxensis DSM 45129]|uniref:ATP-dependent Clp protease ATP-binding subunit ClpX n=1 Tax=Nonomuraea coxensis DSM 45129 TaxID=1122611 RepID=A0ABX8U5D9_9ACTN|nr:ATP-dependent Clp protease ATP-binding subunit ClpX [Nonomuraea coxensis DSM 45129]
MLTTLRPLERAGLVRMPTEPRNALIRQYQRLFELDGVELAFEEDAVAAVAEQALLRRTGARAARPRPAGRRRGAQAVARVSSSTRPRKASRLATARATRSSTVSVSNRGPGSACLLPRT